MAQTFKNRLFKDAHTHLRLRAKVTGTSPSIALLHEIADQFGYFFADAARLRHASERHAYTLSERMRYLKRKRYVQTRQIGNRLDVCLTAEGEARVLRDRLMATKARTQKGWIWLVIFDFPESERIRRDLWRRYLKWLGMKLLQKSVWYTDRDIGPILAEMIQRGGLGDWIQILEARKITK